MFANLDVHRDGRSEYSSMNHNSFSPSFPPKRSGQDLKPAFLSARGSER